MKGLEAFDSSTTLGLIEIIKTARSTSVLIDSKKVCECVHTVWYIPAVYSSNVKKRKNVPISFWKRNQNVLVSFPDFKKVVTDCFGLLQNLLS
jgi:hypothetical protein